MSPATPLPGLVRVDVDDLVPNPDNPREDLWASGLDELAASMRAVGLLHPVLVERIPGSDKRGIIDGHRRWAAAKKLRWPQIPAILRRDMLPDEKLEAALTANGQHAGLDPIEEARAIDRLVRAGRSQAEIAHRLGHSQMWVANRLRLLTLSPAEQEALRAGVDTIGAALSKARVKEDPSPIGGGRGAASSPGWHFTHDHPLAVLAKARCTHLGHSKKRRVSGAVACGECWESVIRADERRHLHDSPVIAEASA